MIKQKYHEQIAFSYPRKRLLDSKPGELVHQGIHWEWANPAEQGLLPLSEYAKFGIDCDRIRQTLENNAFSDRGRYPEAVKNRKNTYNKILKEWDECEKQKNSWKNELR